MREVPAPMRPAAHPFHCVVIVAVWLIVLQAFLAAAAAVCCFAAASAHVTLEKSQAPIGGPYKAVLRVPHGCEGSATTALRIRVPDGMIAVKPMPKPGWKVETVIGKSQKRYDYFH